MEEEVELGNMTLPIEADAMAYSLTRMVESFLYSDLIVGDEPDFENASATLNLLLR